MKRILFAGALFLATALTSTQGAVPAQEPVFTREGDLIVPADYREWVFLSSGLGMTYGPLGDGAAEASPRFDNVFVNPPAYRSFLKTGLWPEHTIFVLEVRTSESKASINNGGRFQTGIAGVEAEVKDSTRFPAKWAFFPMPQGATAAKALPADAACYSCHSQNGAVDNTFVQFYPTLIGIARQHGTLRDDNKR
jgi:hypothetical protein